MGLLCTQHKRQGGGNAWCGATGAAATFSSTGAIVSKILVFPRTNTSLVASVCAARREIFQKRRFLQCDARCVEAASTPPPLPWRQACPTTLFALAGLAWSAAGQSRTTSFISLGPSRCLAHGNPLLVSACVHRIRSTLPGFAKFFFRAKLS